MALCFRLNNKMAALNFIASRLLSCPGLKKPIAIGRHRFARMIVGRSNSFAGATVVYLQQQRFDAVGINHIPAG